MKLIKIVFIFEEMYEEHVKKFIPKREAIFKMDTFSVLEPVIVFNLIDKYLSLDKSKR